MEKEFKNLEGKIAYVETEGGIIASSPLTKQPGTIAYRVIMIMYQGSFAVCNQYFPNYPTMTDIYHADTDYFGGDELTKATKRFASRVQSLSHYTDSLYRTE